MLHWWLPPTRYALLLLAHCCPAANQTTTTLHLPCRVGVDRCAMSASEASTHFPARALMWEILPAHAHGICVPKQDEKQALLEELAASRQRLAAAQEAATCAHMSPATSDRQLAAVEAQLSDARRAANLIEPSCLAVPSTTSCSCLPCSLPTANALAYVSNVSVSASEQHSLNLEEQKTSLSFTDVCFTLSCIRKIWITRVSDQRSQSSS